LTIEEIKAVGSSAAPTGAAAPTARAPLIKPSVEELLKKNAEIEAATRRYGCERKTARTFKAVTTHC